MHVCVCVCACVYMCVCISLCVYMCASVHVYTCMCVHVCMYLCMCVCACVPPLLSGFSLMLLHLSTNFNLQSIFTCYILGDPQRESLKKLFFFLPTLQVGKLRPSLRTDFVKITQQSWDSSGFLHYMAAYATVPVAFLEVPCKPV